MKQSANKNRFRLDIEYITEVTKWATRLHYTFERITQFIQIKRDLVHTTSFEI